MIVIPAIDLMDSGAVRLAQGDPQRATRYDVAPLDLIDRFAAAGVQRIHVVDLDGAFAGAPAQLDLVGELAERAGERGAAIQAGGGIRTAEAVAAFVAAGAQWVVLGTLAARNPEAAQDLCGRYPGRIVVAADARYGTVAVAGWQEQSEITAAALARAAQTWGAAAILHTDVARDGMGRGPAIDATAALQREVEIPVFASGGVGSLEDLDECKAAGIQGVILGRSLYEGAFTIEEAMARC